VTEAVTVFVGGVRQIESVDYVVSSIDPVVVTLTEAPPEGIQVVVTVKQGKSWYQQGATTASNGAPLQNTDTVAARFFRGLY
jgi:phenylpyruvate tautomerase PptA (4-oxalocrotonate tautomerase family)